MVNSKALFDSAHGNAYLIPYDGQKFLLSQVGFGGDLGVFDALVTRGEDVPNLNPNLLFRVHYGRVSPKKWKWMRLGMLPYKDALSLPYSYLHRAVGSDECFLVKYGQDDKRISCDEAGEYEPLATWSHEHIVDRFRRQNRDASGRVGQFRVHNT
jgi:hypothetical protein